MQCLLVVLLVVLVLFYCLSGSLEKKVFNKGGSEAQLLLACMVGPLGVWIRWLLAKNLNGQVLGKNGFLKWVPFGTFIANVSAACVMAVFAILKKAVNTRNFDIVATGIQCIMEAQILDVLLGGHSSENGVFQAHVFSSENGDCAAFLASYDTKSAARVMFNNMHYKLPPWSISILS